MTIQKKNAFMYDVLYNDEDSILFTNDLKKAIKRAEECAKCADRPCVYSVYCVTAEHSMRIMQITVTW